MVAPCLLDEFTRRPIILEAQYQDSDSTSSGLDIASARVKARNHCVNPSRDWCALTAIELAPVTWHSAEIAALTNAFRLSVRMAAWVLLTRT